MLKDKMKTYNFWISLVSAVLLVARLIAGKFNVEIDSSLVMDVTTGLCGIFVVLGIISAPQKTVTKFIDRPLENSAPTSHCEERSDVAIPVLEEGSAPNCHCEERSDATIPVLEEGSAPLGEDGRVATEGVIPATERAISSFDSINQMPNLAEFSKEQLIEIICANPQFLNAGKNSN